MTRWAVSFRSSRRQDSRKAQSTVESTLDTPMRSQKLRMDLGVYPRRRRPQRVGIRGSSHPATWPFSTRARSFRLDRTV